jgi:hypothetical protein
MQIHDDGKSPEESKVALDFLACWKWKDGTNLLGPARPFLFLDYKPFPEGKVGFPEDWKKFWKSESVPGIVGEPRFEGGDLLAFKPEARASLTAAAFRLAAGSPGKDKGPGGKDLGADVDRVGPGKPYEDWKRTSDYQQWRKQTEAILKEKMP